MALFHRPPISPREPEGGKRRDFQVCWAAPLDALDQRYPIISTGRSGADHARPDHYAGEEYWPARIIAARAVTRAAITPYLKRRSSRSTLQQPTSRSASSGKCSDSRRYRLARPHGVERIRRIKVMNFMSASLVLGHAHRGLHAGRLLRRRRRLHRLRPERRGGVRLRTCSHSRRTAR